MNKLQGNFGTIFIIGLISLELFFTYKRKKATLYFAYFCFCMSFTIILTDIIRKNDMLEMKAILDPLTGLYNRTYLSQMEEQCFKEQKNQNRYVLFLDLDPFKSINDTFGHKIGDFILKETAKRLKNLLKNRGTIYRYGGDEIIIIINNVAEDEIINIAKKIIEIITQPFAKEENNYKIGVSVGIASSNSNINNIGALIKNSDEAMYKAKKNGGNQYFLWSEENIKKDPS